MRVLNQHMKQVVDQVRLGFVATVCPDGTPNVSPKGTLCVLDDEHLIFADIRSPGTVTNLRSNQNIEVNVVDPFSRKGYRFKGLAVVHEQGPVFEAFVAFFAKRKLADAPRRIKSIVVIDVVSAQPLISPAYDEGAIEQPSIRNLQEGPLSQEILALMQHHGAPTRLMDWTYSPFIATSFALESGKGPAAVWALDAKWIEEQAKKFIPELDEYDRTRDNKIFEKLFMPYRLSKPELTKMFVYPVNPIVLNKRLRIGD